MPLLRCCLPDRSPYQDGIIAAEDVMRHYEAMKQAGLQVSCREWAVEPNLKEVLMQGAGWWRLPPALRLAHALRSARTSLSG